MKQYLYKLELIERLNNDDNWTEKDNQIVEEHFNYLKDRLNHKQLILAGRTLNMDNTKFGIVIIEVETDEIAESIMLNDPAIKNGIMIGHLYPYRVALLRES